MYLNVPLAVTLGSIIVVCLLLQVVAIGIIFKL